MCLVRDAGMRCCHARCVTPYSGKCMDGPRSLSFYAVTQNFAAFRLHASIRQSASFVLCARPKKSLKLQPVDIFLGMKW